MIVAFYSYKGGVGRTMALANVGEILAEWGYRVVLCDWDLEAPGLERYFNPIDTPSFRDKEARVRYNQFHDQMLEHDGLMDLFDDYKELLSKALPDRPISENMPADKVAVGKLVLRRPSAVAFTPPTARNSDDDRLRLLSAGRRETKERLKLYGDKVLSFDWTEFYEKWAGNAYVDFFRKELLGDPRGERSPADIVLVDSRTGVTEQGGVCTHHLADLVVVLGAPNEANIAGTLWMADSLTNNPKLIDSRGGRKLSILPVIARVDVFNENELYMDFEKYFIDTIEKYLPAAINEGPEYFKESRIPAIGFYSFRERVVAREPREKRKRELYRPYEQVAYGIVRHGLSAGLLSDDRAPEELHRLTPPFPRRRSRSVRGHVFVSCSAEDAKMATTVIDALQRRGVDASGDPAMLASASTAIFIVGENGMSESMRSELDFVIHQSATGKQTTIVPLLADQKVFPSPLLVGYRTCILPPEPRADAEFFDDLLSAVTAPAFVALDEDAKPYKGVQTYRESDARFFFGRDDEIAQLQSAVASSATNSVRWLRVEGASGVGITSLVSAGLLPAIRRGSVRGIARDAAVVSCQLAGDPLANLAASLAVAPAKPVIRADEIVARFEKPAEIADYVAQLLRRRPTVLFIDCIDLLHDQPEKIRRQFCAVVAALLEKQDLPLILITTSRRGSAVPPSLEAVAKSAITVTIDAIDGRRMREVVVGPAALAGITFETGLVERIATEAAGTTRTPAFLSFTLSQLWQAAQARRSVVITHAMYEDVGRIAGVVASMAEEALRSLHDSEQDIARSMVLRVVSASESRVTATVGVLLGGSGGRDTRERVLGKLADLCLIRVDGETAELSHDGILNAPTISSWTNEERIKLQQRAELELAARSWLAANRPWRRLPTGAQLSYYETVETPSFEVAEYLASAKRFTRSIGVVWVLIVTVIIGLATRQVWTSFTASPDSALAQAIIDGKLNSSGPHAVLAAATSLHGTNTSLTRKALRMAIELSLAPQTYDTTQPVIGIDLSLDGRILALAEATRITVFDTTRHARVMTLVSEGVLRGIQLNREGTLLLVDHADRLPEVWRVPEAKIDWYLPARQYRPGNLVRMSADGAMIAVIDRFSGTLSIFDRASRDALRSRYPARGAYMPDIAKHLMFSPRGNRIVAFGQAGSVWIWTNFGNRVITSTGNGEAVSAWDFTPDGRYMVTYSANGVLRCSLENGAIENLGRPRRVGEAAIAIGIDGNPIVVEYLSGGLVLLRQGGHNLFYDMHARLSDISSVSNKSFLIGGEKGLAVLTYDGVITQAPAGGDTIAKMRVVDKPLRAALLLKSRTTVQLWDVDAQTYRNVQDVNLLDAARLRLAELSR